MNVIKKIVVLLLICIIGIGGAACAPANGGKTDSDSVQDADTGDFSQQLEILRSDMTLSQDQLMSRMKAEYLIKNEGYKDDDEIVAILSLGGDAIIDKYLETDSAAMTVEEYAGTAAGRSLAYVLGNEQDRLINKLTTAGLISGVNYKYSTVLNAISVNTTYGNLAKLESYAEVETASIADTFNRPQEATGTDASAIVNDVDVYPTGIFNSGSVADLGITGKGTAVAILDSGFDLSHPVFNTHEPEGELLLTRNEIEGVMALTESDGNGGERYQLNAKQTTPTLKISDVWYSEKIPFSYDYADKDYDVFPYDSEHGTHVAGIIGGKDDEITGVAIDTQLVLMKVFPDLNEGAETDDILAALEDAVLLNVDCINLSLGSSCGFAREPDGDVINEVYDKIDQSGVSLITAASNSYSSGYGGEQGNTSFVTNPDSGTVGSPSSYAGALSVASISGIKSKYLVGNGKQVVFFNESNNIAGDPNDFFAELYKAKGWSTTDNAEHTIDYVAIPGYGYRANYTNIDVDGKIALVSRGDSTFEDKALQAKIAGAAACIIYNNIEGDILMSMGKSDHIPTISISREDGVELAKTRNGSFTISYKNQAGPFMSDFSSWGPLPDLKLKPEITAHGGEIRSSVPGGGYDELSGTSMASPNMCGIVVLIRQFLKQQDRYKDHSWKQISILANQMLMSTANIVLNQDGNPYSPRKQGAGLASLYNVVHTGAYLTVDGLDRTKLELGDDAVRKGVYDMTFNIVNVSDKQLKYDLSVVGMTESVSTSDANHVAEKDRILKGGAKFTAEGSGGSLSGTTVTVNAGESLKIKATYTLTNEDKTSIDEDFPYGMYVEGFVKLASQESGEGDVDLSIPFLAYYGDWTQAPIFDKTYYEVESEAHNAGIDEEDKIKADYYATTPYGSYNYNYMIPLGAYLYDIDTSMYDYIPATEDHIAISDTLGMIDGISAVYAGVLRNCKTMTYTIVDKLTGEVMYENVVQNARKAYSNGASPVPNYEYLRISSHQTGLINNRQYEFKMQGKLDYGDGGLTTNARNTFSFDFYLDNEAPVIKSAIYEKEYDRTLKKDRYYVTLTVYDNRDVMCVWPMVFESSSSITPLTENPIPVYGETGKDNTIRIEITDYLEDIGYDALINSAITFMTQDYALNQNLYVCQLPGTNGPFKFTADGKYDGSTLTYKTIGVNEVVDLTQYLATDDETVDANKDYLKHLVWSSSNESIARVQEGQVIGVKAGSARITVKEQMNVNTRSASISIIVSGTGAISLAEEDYGISTVSNNDVDDATSAGLSSLRFSYFETIFAHARGGQTSEIGSTGDRMFISSLPGGRNNPQLSMYPAEQIRLFYDLDPWYVADRYPLTFETSNDEVAEVTQEGVVTAKKKGSATITLRAQGSNIMARLRLTVNSEFVIDDARTLVAYKGMGGDVVIPDDEGILYIDSFAFSLYETDYDYGQELPEDDFDANKIPQVNRTVTSVTVPNGVTEIRKYAFYNCLGLKKVTLPTTVKFVREFSFYGDDELTEINLNNVEAIGANAFAGCTKLNNINLTKTYSIGDRAFDGCTSLEAVDISALRNTGREAFRGCTALSDVKFDQNGKTKLAYGMFVRSGLESVTIYEKVSVPDYCFAQCENLSEIIVQNDLVSIGMGAFCQNPQLKTVTFNGTVGTLGDQVLYSCPELTEITLPNGSFSMGEAVMYGCGKLATVKLGENTEITSSVATMFHGTKLSNFVVPDGNTHYSVSADGHMLLSKDGKEIVLVAIEGIDKNVVVKADIERIASGAFSGTPVETVKFENPDIKIGDFAFAGCTELRSVELAADAGTVIGNRAFVNCEKLAEVKNLASAREVGEYAFGITFQSTNKLTSVEIGENAVYGEGAFFRSGLKSVTIGKGAKIGDGAFQYCRDLETVIMPDGDVTFGMGVFALDTLLSDIDLSNITEITEQMFYGCTSLRAANMTSALHIGPYAFSDCSSLVTVEMPAVQTIGEGAFARNSETGSAPSMYTLVLPATLTEMGDGAFLGCSNLSEITIPDGVTAIPGFAFAYCFGLTKVVLPDTVEKIGDYAFMACAGLEDINLGKVKLIGEAAFMSQYMYSLFTSGGSSGQITIHALTNIDLSSAESIGFAAFAGSMVTGDISSPNLKTIDAYAFYKVNGSVYNDIAYPTIESVDAPLLETVGYSAFEGNITLKEFKVYDKLTKVDAMAFVGCTALEAFTDKDGKTTAVVSNYAEIEDGLLYTRLPSGKMELNSVPGGKNVETLTVRDGTARIEDYAGNANTHVRRIILPDSLENIGDHAFYGYTALTSVEFRSVTAPVLESTWLYTSVLNENHPGYHLLHNQYNMYSVELGYYNFIDLAGIKSPITMVLPANSDIEGYDSIIYLAYFGEVANASRSGYTAMERSMKNFIDYAARLKKVETLTLADETLVNDAVSALNAIKQDPTAYGYTSDEWKELTDMVLTAKNSIARMKIINAKKAVRDAQALIDALPDVYEKTSAHNALLSECEAAIGALSMDDRSLLIQDKYNSFRSQYEAANGSTPGSSDDSTSDITSSSEEEEGGCGCNKKKPEKEEDKKGCKGMLGGANELLALIAVEIAAATLKRKNSKIQK